MSLLPFLKNCTPPGDRGSREWAAARDEIWHYLGRRGCLFRVIAIMALLLLLQDPSFDDLLRDLRDDSAEVREKAASGLVKLGEGALVRLKLEREKAVDLDLKSRLEKVIASIQVEKRRKHFKGGPVTDGFCAALTVEQDKNTGEAVFRMEILNVDTRTRELVAIDAWDFSTPYGPVKPGIHTRFRKAHASMGISFDPPKEYPPGTVLKGGMQMGCFEDPSRNVERLEPGESRVYSMRMKLDPDGYKARATYYADSKKLIPGATADLVTNFATFRID